MKNKISVYLTDEQFQKLNNYVAMCLIDGYRGRKNDLITNALMQGMHYMLEMHSSTKGIKTEEDTHE